MGHCVAIDGKDEGTIYHFEVGLDDRDLWVFLWKPERRKAALSCNPQYFGAHYRWERHGRPLPPAPVTGPERTNAP